MTSQLAPKILLLLILFCSCASPALSVDRIYQSGASLSSSHTLLSNNANFTLGFQRIGTEESNASYLGIWYSASKYWKDRPFWLANPNNPIPDDSGALAIDASGNFKLTSSAGHVLTIYSSQSSTTNLTAVLQDSGNLILKEADSPDDKFLWQSFDFPTDSLLSGMKLGINHRTGETWSLNSRLTESVPSSGAFNLEWDSNEHQLVIKRRGTIFWTSGPLTSNDSFEAFSMSSEMFDPLRYSFINVSNADEDYFMFTVAPYFTMWWLSEDGSIIHESSSRVVGGSICDGNRAEFGCKKWEGPQCRNDGDKFVQRSGYFVNSVPTREDDNSSLSKSDCKDMCWKDCRCVAIPLEYNANNTGCMFYYGDITPDPTGTVTTRYYVIVQESPPERNWIWILIVVALVVIIALGSILFYLRRKRIRDKLLNDLLAMDDTTNDIQEFENDGNNGHNGHNLKLYSVAEIMAATNSFSLKNKLGQGGFGPVYKGKLPEGREIAVKRLSKSSGQGLVEFKNELILIAKLQHRNLVRLLGFCIHGEEKMLVYEYMPNKSLDSFIFDSSKSGLIDWKRRFEIIEGIAQGMLYLHKYSRLRIIHRDLKASNILLDQDLNPKVSDFGMARIFQINQIESNTNRIVGTYGYMSPEYAMEGVFSVKSDVFSFGVLLLEIVSGRKNHGFLQMDRPLNLIGYAWELWREGNPLKLVDPKLRDSLYSKEEVLRCIKLGLLCVENNPSDRPTMSDVVTMLASESAQLPAPKQPAFSNARCILDVNSSFVKQETNSINTYSTSTLEAR